MTERHARAATLQEQARTLRQDIADEIRALAPLGRVNEVAVIMGYNGRGVAVSTPLGTFAFAKARRPSGEQVAGWYERHQKAEALSRESARLSGSFAVCDPGTTIGNQTILEAGREFASEGLLTEAELEYLARLEDFWASHPDELTGVVREDGSIQPWTEAEAEMRSIHVEELSDLGDEDYLDDSTEGFSSLH